MPGLGSVLKQKRKNLEWFGYTRAAETCLSFFSPQMTRSIIIAASRLDNK